MLMKQGTREVNTYLSPISFVFVYMGWHLQKTVLILPPLHTLLYLASSIRYNNTLESKTVT